MNTRYFQQGMSAGQIMLLLVAIGFGATIAISVIPVYIDNGTVSSALQSVQEAYEGKDIQDISDREIRGKLGNYFQINMVSREVEEAVRIVREKDTVSLSINYEIRKPLMGNVDIVMSFENQVNLGGW
jgi:hypothetical protein